MGLLAFSGAGIWVLTGNARQGFRHGGCLDRHWISGRRFRGRQPTDRCPTETNRSRAAGPGAQGKSPRGFPSAQQRTGYVARYGARSDQQIRCGLLDPTGPNREQNRSRSMGPGDQTPTSAGGARVPTGLGVMPCTTENFAGRQLTASVGRDRSTMNTVNQLSAERHTRYKDSARPISKAHTGTAKTWAKIICGEIDSAQ